MRKTSHNEIRLFAVCLTTDKAKQKAIVSKLKRVIKRHPNAPRSVLRGIGYQEII